MPSWRCRSSLTCFTGYTSAIRCGTRDLTTTLRKLLQLAVVLLVGIILTSLLFGRKLERAYPFLVQLVGVSGIALGFALLACIAWSAARGPRRVAGNELGKRLLVAVVILACAWSACESLIILPIERIHFVKYGLLALILPYAVAKPGFLTVAHLRWALVIALSIGTAEETAQLLVPERFFDLRDLAINTTGVLFGHLLAAAATPASRLHPVVGPLADA